MADAHVAEVFSSIQGEGIHVGRLQVFCRLSGCNLSCCYCDTPETRQLAPTCTVDALFEGGAQATYDNPVSARRTAEFIRRVNASSGPHHSVAITGGEPLLSAEFVAELAAGARQSGLGVYLETNGTLPDALRQVIDNVDMVALDAKLPSAVGGLWFHELARSLEACAGTEAFVKVIVTAETTEAELRSARDTVAAVDDRIPFVIQPVTATPGASPPARRELSSALGIAREKLRDVRVIPQVHKLMGWR